MTHCLDLLGTFEEENITKGLSSIGDLPGVKKDEQTTRPSFLVTSKPILEYIDISFDFVFDGNYVILYV